LQKNRIVVLVANSRFILIKIGGFMKALYTAQVHVTGGRDGSARSSDGHLDVQMGMPKAMGGNDKGTNPEQLFAAGFAACFQGALGVAARARKVSIADCATDSEVSLYPKEGGGFYLGVKMDIVFPSLDKKTAEELVQEAHKICPYSNATRGNIEVAFTVRGKA
jgi:osmotically inducible protein OsmC